MDFFPLVSVIVVFKNEAKHLKSLIEKISKQDYPNFEIILVNDFSTDHSLEVVKSIFDTKIKVYNAPIDKPGKKAALDFGIHQASGEYVLLTDADCMPASVHWIRNMVNILGYKNEIVLGYGPNFEREGWLNKFQRFETIVTALQYFSYAHAKIPYMGVGRNLLYSKDLYLKSKDKAKGKDLASGDDDLNIMAMANKYNTGSSIDPNSFCFSEAKPDLVSFLKQKTRHVSTSYHYSSLHKCLLGLFSLSHMMFWFLLLIVMPLKGTFFFFAFILPILMFRWVIGWWSLSKLDGKSLRLFYPILDLLLAVYYLVVGIKSITSQKDQW